jgi:hypothetical protein
MSESMLAIPVGRVLRANLTSYVIGCRAQTEQLPAFGSLVKTDADEPVLGLVYDIVMSDDPLVKQLIVAGNRVPEEIVQDQLQNRRLPVEISVLATGFYQGGRIRQGIPPRPPLSLDFIFRCDDDELTAFTERSDYLSLLLGNQEAPADELMVAHLQQAAAARPSPTDEYFLQDTGRELARLLAGDMLRLDAILRRITSERNERRTKPE